MGLQRHEALRFVQNNLNIIISDLETLEARVKPALAPHGVREVQVGVHLGHTCDDGLIKYYIVAVDPIMRLVHAVDFNQVVSNAIQDYKDKVYLSVRPVQVQRFYPQDPVLSLELLKDMQKAALK
jgi:hypothetical protein